MNCPQCGNETDIFVEGYCQECHDERQRQLDEHNASYDFWNHCSDSEREYYIRKAAGL